MWLIAGFGLWIVPVFTYRYARRIGSSHVWCVTGIALGTVASVASLGTYCLYWLAGFIGLMGLPFAALGILGLALALFHGTPGFYLATILGLCSRGVVVHGIEFIYIESLNSLIWAVVYGAIGYALDSLIRRWRTRN